MYIKRHRKNQFKLPQLSKDKEREKRATNYFPTILNCILFQLALHLIIVESETNSSISFKKSPG